jgi:hypothetical protein
VCGNFFLFFCTWALLTTRTPIGEKKEEEKKNSIDEMTHTLTGYL